MKNNNSIKKYSQDYCDLQVDRHSEQRPISPKISASSTPHKRVHYDIENESRYMRFRSKVITLTLKTKTGKANPNYYFNLEH